MGQRLKGVVGQALALGLSVLFLASSANAQSEIQNILTGLGQAQQQQQNGVQNPTVPLPSTVNASQQTLTAQAATPAPPLPPSRLEQIYSERAGRPLTQFGYDQLGSGSPVSVSQIGAVQDTYILGAGDQLVVTFRGHENATYQVSVDRDGRIVLPGLEPIPAAGRPFGQVRDDIVNRVTAEIVGTKAFVTVASVRQISVLVTGEVQVPGMRQLSGLNTALDAILLSGGIKKTGSLRSITIVRGGQQYNLDLYAVIANGSTSLVAALADGDRIYIPPLGSTVAVAGFVKRPGIYELARGARAIDARSLAELAGGLEIEGASRISKLEIEPDGRTRMIALNRNGIIRGGEIVFIDPNRSSTFGKVTLQGAVSVPGLRSLIATPTIASLVRDPDDLTPEAYTLFSVVVRRDHRSNLRTAHAFSLKRAFDGAENEPLANDDRVYIFTQSEVQILAAAAAADLANEAVAATQPANFGLTPQTGQLNPNAAFASSPGGSPTPVQNLQNPQFAQTQTPQGPASPFPYSSGPPQSPGSAAGLQAQPQAGVASPGGYPTTQTMPNGQTPATQSPPQSIGSTGYPLPPQQMPVQPALPPVQGQPAYSLPTTDVSAPQPPATTVPELARRLQMDPGALVRFARDYLVWVNGEVRSQGAYLADSGTSLHDLLQAAGGLQLQADLSSVEVTTTKVDAQSGTSQTVRKTYRQEGTTFDTVLLEPLDSVRVRPVFSDRESGQVTVLGEVKFPGTFDITRGERLSSVLVRAGGLTEESYPYGAVFTRLSAAQAEQQGNQRTAAALEDEIPAVASDPQATQPEIAYLATLAKNLRDAPVIGRITVTADPVVLATHPDIDVLLEPGDKIYIPKRPSTVSVSGEVLNAGAFQYKSDHTVDDYVAMAGGYTRAADDDSLFVLLPDGSARPQRHGFWALGSDKIPPGSTVVVPRDPTPFVLDRFLTTALDIMSKLAITGASLAIIAKQ